jgi:hypothetical protein
MKIEKNGSEHVEADIILIIIVKYTRAYEDFCVGRINNE